MTQLVIRNLHVNIQGKEILKRGEPDRLYG
jgi:hypothetical protein